MSWQNKIIAITPFLCLIAFLLLYYNGLGHPGWLVFLLIPVMPFIVGKKRIKFSVPLVITIIYLILGAFGLWHPWWVIFLLIPVFQIILTPERKFFKYKNINDNDDEF